MKCGSTTRQCSQRPSSREGVLCVGPSQRVVGLHQTGDEFHKSPDSGRLACSFALGDFKMHTGWYVADATGSDAREGWTHRDRKMVTGRRSEYRNQPNGLSLVHTDGKVTVWLDPTK